MSINATVLGNVTKDAKVKAAGSNVVVKWGVAVNRKQGGTESVTFVQCSWFGKRAEKVAQYITKGGKIAVYGELYQREYNGKQYVELDVTNVDLIGGARGGQSPAPAAAPSGNGFSEADYGPNPADDNSFPF